MAGFASQPIGYREGGTAKFEVVGLVAQRSGTDALGWKDSAYGQRFGGFPPSLRFQSSIARGYAHVRSFLESRGSTLRALFGA